MTNTPKPWGELALDEDCVRNILVVTGTTTIREAGQQLLALKPTFDTLEDHERDPRFAYLLVPVADGRYAVIRWFEIEQQASGPSTLDLTLAELLKGKPTVVALERGFNYQKAFELRDQQPGYRAVVVQQGTPIAMFAIDNRSAVSKGYTPDLLATLSPASQTQIIGGTLKEEYRQVNIWFDSDRGKPARPLGVGTRYILHCDVSPARPESFVQEVEIGSLAEFADSADQQTVTMTFLLEVNPTELEILGPRIQTIEVPAEKGASLYEALFQIKPLTVGETTLKVRVLVKDQPLQRISFKVNVDKYEAEHPFLEHDRGDKAEVDGYSIESMALMRPRINPVNLIISPTTTGYDLTLISGTSSRATITLTEHSIADLVRDARKTLKDIVYGKEGNTPPYLVGWEIDPAIHQKTLEKLADTGRRLFDSLFFNEGEGSSAATMGNLLLELARQKRQLNISVVAQKFIFPWSMIYDGPEDEPVTFENFWGFRHIIQHLPESGTPALTSFVPTIEVKDKLEFTFFFNEGIDAQMKRPLIEDQRTFFKQELKGVTLAERKSEQELLDYLSKPKTNPAQVIYLYCHAESYGPGDRNRQGEELSALDSRVILTQGTSGLTVRDMQKGASLRIKLESAPFVYLNACQGAEMSPFLYEGLVPYLIKKGARGVMGTEVDTPALFAAEFGKRFIKRFVEGDQTVGELLLALRREFVEQHNNVMGLVYSLYSSGDVIVERP